MPLTPPNESNDYQVTNLHVLDEVLWNLVLGSVGRRLRQREDLEANFQQLIDDGYTAALNMIQTNLTPELAAVQQAITDAQNAINAIITQGQAPDSALLGGELPAAFARAADAALTGTPTAPTAAPGTNSTQIATTAYVLAVRDALVQAAPGALDTLNELASALGNDPNFAASVTAQIAANASDLATKADASATISALATKADASTTAAALATKADSAEFAVDPLLGGAYRPNAAYCSCFFTNVLAGPRSEMVLTQIRNNGFQALSGSAYEVPVPVTGRYRASVTYLGANANTFYQMGIAINGSGVTYARAINALGTASQSDVFDLVVGDTLSLQPVNLPHNDPSFNRFTVELL